MNIKYKLNIIDYYLRNHRIIEVKEELYRSNYKSEADFKRRLEEYFEFYNNERPHATIGYKTPNAYEDLFHKKSPIENN